MSNQKTKHNQSKRSLMVAIEVASILLLVLIALTVVLSRKNNTSGDKDRGQTTESTQSVGSTNPSDPMQSGENTATQPSGESQSQDSNVPTETAPLVLEQGLYVVHMGNFSGQYVEDGSDAQLENFCAAVVENRTEKTIQLLQFKVTSGDRVYDFRLTTLPPGERAIVQDMNKASFVTSEAIMTADVELCVFFEEEPTLHEDVFAISGTEKGIELRNLTDAEIPGPIYVYYKTRTADGYGGGITYRITIPGLAANGVYSATVNHFWPGSSQVMFIDYAQ